MTAALLIAGCGSPEILEADEDALRQFGHDIVSPLFVLDLPAGDSDTTQQSHIAVQTSASLGDLNGDGMPEVMVLPNRTAHRARLFESVDGEYAMGAPFEYGYDLGLEDWDDDGQPDVLIKGGQAAERDLTVYMIDRDAPGGAEDKLIVWQRLTGNESFHLIDVDRDGIRDLAIVHHFALQGPDGLYNISFWVGTGSRALNRPPFELRQRIYLPEYGRQKAIRWGNVMHPRTKQGRLRPPRWILTGSASVRHPIGYLQFNMSAGRFDSQLHLLEQESFRGITSRVAHNVSMLATRDGLRAYRHRRRAPEEMELFFSTTRPADDFWCITNGQHVPFFITVEKRFLIVRQNDADGLAEFRKVAQIRVPKNSRYLSFFHSERGMVEHHAPDRMILSHRNGATIFELNLPELHD